MRKLFFVTLLLVFSFSLIGQEWIEGMHDYRVNFFDVQADFNKYWKKIEKQAEENNLKYRPSKSSLGYGWAQYKRWEAFWEPRVGESGERPNPGILWQETQRALTAANGGGSSVNQSAGNWTPIGPMSAPNNQGWTGIGRINCIAFDPINTNTVWVGAPAGGLWKSTDGGINWSTNTDLLQNLGVSAIAIDPLHPDTMYISTGDMDGGDTYSYGVLKSVDGGMTWNTTALSFNVNDGVKAGAIYIHPTNTQIIVIATHDGLYRSTDGLTTVTGVGSGKFHTLAADPQNPHKIFAGTNTSPAKVFVSNNSGANWTQITSGLPTNGVRRVQIAISPQDSNYVYALYGASNNGYYGTYRSTDGGSTWSLRSSSPNILDWSTNGSGSGGQAWYDLAFAVSPTNKQQIFVGGINIWRSNNGGSSWTQVAHWYGGGGAPTVHADIHYFKFQPNSNTLYTGTDGGVYKTSNAGGSWTALYNNMNITQYYKISQSLTNANLILGGAQDNGTHRLSGISWDQVNGGDGMDNAIDPDNNQIMYCSVYHGNFYRSTNGGNSFSTMNIPASNSGNWVTPFLIDPTNSNNVYAGYDKLYKSSNKGVSWAATSNSAINGANIDVFTIAPSNGQIIYVGINADVFRSANGGSSWTNISNNLPGSDHVTGIAVSSANPSHIWVTRSGYTTGQRVFETTNAGVSWTNVSSGLPNLPVNCIVYEDGSYDGVYAGTDVGVYYRDSTMSSWISFMSGLPNVIVNDLEIFYTDSKIRAGTYGRGVWESDLYSTRAPIADFRANPFSVCSTVDTVTLFDESLYNPTTWAWSIYPSTYTFVNGTSDTSQNPQLVFTSKGAYTITLEVSNSYGSTKKVSTRAVEIGGASLPFTEDFETQQSIENWTILNPDNNLTWTTTTVGGNTPGNQAMFMDFYNYNSVGQKDGLISPPLSFEGYGSVNLTFDHAYKQFDNSTFDSLNIYVSTDCGQTWTLVQSFAEDGLNNWRTGSNSTVIFTPTSSGDWCGGSYASCKTVNLNSYAGNDEVRIKFESVNDYGNALYLDNINITGTLNTKPVADFIGDTAGCSVQTFSFYDVSDFNPTSWNWTFQGGTPSTSTIANPQVSFASGGTYAVTLVATNAVGSDTVVKSSFITVDQAQTASVNLTTNNSTICEGESLTITATPTNGGTNPVYDWYKNGGQIAVASGNSLTVSNATSADVFSCVLRSNATCVYSDSVGSNSVSVNVLPAPVVSLNPFASVCVADAAFPLSGGTPAGGTYSGQGVSNGAFDPSSVGIGGYSITYSYTSANGCTASTNQVISVENGPPKPLISYNNFILKASPISSAYSYQWFDGNGNAIAGATDTSFIPWSVGNYSVQLTFINGCTNLSDPYPVAVVGIEEGSLDKGVNVYPNPVVSTLNIELFLNRRSATTFSIFDVSGRMVFYNEITLDMGLQTQEIDLERLVNGTYILEVNDGKQIVKKRFVKQ